MPLARPLVYAGGLPRMMYAGDLLSGGESITAGAIATAGAGSWTGAAIATGLIRRTGPVGGYTDTLDTAANIIAALAGNLPAADIAPGTSFRLKFINTVAQAHTYANGRGTKSGTGTLTTAASCIHDYLLTILNASPEVSLQGTFTNAAAAVVFTLPPNMTAFPLGAAVNPQGIAITPGMTITDSTTGGNISANTTVIGVTQGAGGITGVTMSANGGGNSAAAPGDLLIFSPTILVDSLGSYAFNAA